MRKFQLTQCEINNLEINGDNAIIEVIKSLQHNIQKPYIVYLLDAKKNIEDSINDRLQNSSNSYKKQLQYAKSELLNSIDFLLKPMLSKEA
tara:strand:- start:522 stop:794 length:273 start_codon:yes stop_codon:yes gene_type:complete